MTRRLFLPLLAAAAEPARTVIHQEVDFKVTPTRIYDALMDARQFQMVTGMPAEMQPYAGGTFKLFGGHIEGRNIELIPNRRIVQVWRETSWQSGYYSLVKFELIARAGSTHLVFDQTGIVDSDFGHLNEGWPLRYWDPLRHYLNG